MCLGLGLGLGYTYYGAQLEEDRHLQRLEARAKEANDVRVAQVTHKLHLLHELAARGLGEPLAQQPLHSDARSPPARL